MAEMIRPSDDVLFRWDVDAVRLVAVSARVGRALQLDEIDFTILETSHRLRAPDISRLSEEAAARTRGVVDERLARLLEYGILEKSDSPRLEDAFYSPMLYYHMFTDRVKMEAFEQAVCDNVTRGMRVLHAGCGLGIFAIWAAKRGAEVWAIDDRPIVHRAREIATDNGVADRISFLRGDVLDPTLAAKLGRFDLVISEFIGDEIFDEGILHKSHWLHVLYQPERLIPRGMTGWAVSVESSEATRRVEEKLVGVESLEEHYDLELRALRRLVLERGLANDIADRLYVHSFQEIACDEFLRLGSPVVFYDADLMNVAEVLFARIVRLPIEKKGRLDGVLLYFTAHLDDGTDLTSDPWSTRGPTHWPQVVHLSTPPREVSGGDECQLGVAYAGGKGLAVSLF